MSADKPNFDTVFIATAAAISGPRGVLSMGGGLNKERFKRVFKELLEIHNDCQDIFVNRD